ncbi:MAG: helix-turn-helix transcriptional regulator [Hyphomicrobiaceae bacterium]
MRRADRLFEIIQILRRKKLVRAADLSEALEVSERTIYRDISDLMASGVPIEGEAGVGYVLRQGFDLPPLMFNEQEIEALVLGARIVQSWADCELADAAGDVIAKVEAVVPERLRSYMEETALLAPPEHFFEPISFEIADLRRAVRNRQKVEFDYQDALGGATHRVVRPLSLAFFGPSWCLAAWCELREDFRTFRLDRMLDFAMLDERFGPERGKTLNDFLKRPHTWTAGVIAQQSRLESTANTQDVN